MALANGNESSNGNSTQMNSSSKPGQRKQSSRLKSGDYNEVDIEWCIVKRIWLMTDQIDSFNWKEFERIRGIGHFLTSAVMTTWFLSSDKTWSRAFQASASISLMTPRWRFQDDKKLKTKHKRDWFWKLRGFQVDWSMLSKLLSAYRCYLVTLIILSLVRPKLHMFNGR